MATNSPTEFKALVLGNENSFIYIDINRLHKGLYSQPIPILFSMNETIDSIWRKYSDIVKIFNESESIFKDNLYRCKLIIFRAELIF